MNERANLFFKVGNMRKDFEYKFSIVNFSKSDSQYSVGMKPVLYSTKEAKRTGVGWTRTGDNIRYYKDVSTGIGEPGRFVMSFSLMFPHSEDEVYLAHCYPYRNIMEQKQLWLGMELWQGFQKQKGTEFLQQTLIS